MKTRYTVAEKAVMARDGINYNLACYKEGADYVVRKCFKSFKHMFRSDILGVSVVDPSLVEHKQEPLPPDHPVFIPPFERATLELDEKGLRITFPEVKPEDWRPSAPSIKQEQVIPHQDVQECKILKIYPNFKWVDTDKGRVWVGLKGVHMRVNQVIRVKSGELFTGKTGPSGSLVRV
jgi:hypothetical protein